MCRILHILPLLLVPSALPETLLGEPDYANSRALTLSFQTPNTDEIDRVLVWVSDDNGETWTEAPVARTADKTVRFDAQQDGNYCFYILLENGGGRSGSPPTGGIEPHASVVVDTAAPTVQIHRAEQVGTAGGEPLVRLNVSLVEENLGEAGCRTFYRANGAGAWRDGGPADFCDGVINWRPPPDIVPKTDLRLVVTDLAGNQASDEIHDLRISAVAADVPATPVTRQAPPSGTPGGDVVSEVIVSAVAPVTIDPVPEVTLAEQPRPTPAPQPVQRADEQAQRLRDQAARYLAQGRLSLAGARLQDALELASGDPELQVDLGSVLYRTRQYDQARHRFQAALDASPNHLGAIEGLALVAATQNRYPQARSHLQHLLRLSPESGRHWLHYGDIEHMLGNTAAAHAAWEKVPGFESADQALREKAEKRLRLFRRVPANAK